jgi:serine protease Do
VVRLDVAQAVYKEGKRSFVRGIGSGVIIDDKGHILTNFHVAGRAAEIYVTLFNKERVPARLVGADHWTDLAVVQIDMEEVARRKIAFAHAELGTSSGLRVGQDVIAIGTPFGLARTMTLGIVSNNERTFYPDQQSIDEYETGNFSNWIQMDTPIAPGNSGGPLVDLNGKIVGINTRGMQGQSLNFAIPIDLAKNVSTEILKTATDAQRGRVNRADLGIDFKPMQDLETYYDIDTNRGVLVNSVDRTSPAAKAGLQAQDILLTLDGKPTNVRFPEEIAPLRQRIADLPIGSEVSVELLRGGKPMKLSMTTVKLESVVGEEREAKVWGLSVREVTRAYANNAQLEDADGVIITSLTRGWAADKAELTPGDIIRSVNGKNVTDLDSFMKLYEESVEKKDKLVLLKRMRGGRGLGDALLKVSY